MGTKLLQEIKKGTKSAMMKKKLIMHYIYNGSSTITDLSKEMDLSVPTITKFVDEMCEDGYINDYGKLETSGGRHPSLYGLNADSGYFLGVELRQKDVSMGLINFKGDVVKLEMNVPFNVQNTIQCLDEFCALIQNFISKLPVPSDKILNINVDLTGRVNPSTGYSYSLFNFDERPLTDLLEERLPGFQVSIDNDTRGMTYGEFMQGAVQGQKNVIVVNVSWGLAMGIIIDGKLYRGKSGFTGEFGHNYGYDNEIICHCGKKGCVETEVSCQALYRMLIEHIRNGENSIVTTMVDNLEDITFDDILSAINKEDVLCIDLVEEIGVKLGRHIAGLINIFNPELVVIGGDLSLTGDYLIQPVTTAIRKYTLNLMNRDTTIVPSKLKERAGIIGSCMLSRTKLFAD